jgi:hypothetical protein
MSTEPNISRSKPGREKTGQTAQAAKRAAVDQNRIAQRAYELYEQRGRQEGRALEGSKMRVYSWLVRQGSSHTTSRVR